jgi:hypothetical protein
VAGCHPIADCKQITINKSMKTAYELAMERLSKSSPAIKLSPEQKQKLADLDAKYAAKIAEREIFLKDQLDKAAAKGEWEEMQQLEKQLVSERKSLTVERDEKKAQVRNEKA